MNTIGPEDKEKKGIPSTDFVGEITIGNATINCAVLFPDTEKPVRVIVQREVVGLLTGNKKGGFERYLKPDNLKNYVPDKFKNGDLKSSTIEFKLNGRTSQGFIGSDVIDLCKMYMQARTDNKLLAGQKHLAVQAEIIVFAFAKLGVDGLIDDVTGYDKVRPRYALNRLFEKYIEEEARKWAKRFPDEFYRLIFKLNKWSYTEETIKSAKRPSIIGTWTKEIIYSRFPKGVLSKLEDKNPITNNSNRKHKHHQFLSDIGNDELKEYISNAIFLMKSCTDWKQFKRALARTNGQDYQGDMFNN